ncbi:MAG: hypothetical protein A3H28_06450 [Acidobacteria bacterium RIFCSPLOWO2_02_FULL_61_28]|nr:MAG: hypothetical protein A3H28_06450 [Acidobacteria bacterium RIFCSPLOWO2_02_FULL_61_28]
MPPTKIRVKLVSEAAEYVSITHVVQRDFSLTELVETMLPILGKDAPRIRQILRAGTLSTGEYRYRWEPLEVEERDLESLLGSLPGPEPSRAFQPDTCFLVRFRRGPETLDLPRESASRKQLFARQSFWDGLLALAGDVHYADYSHADRADVFALPLDRDTAEQLCGLLSLFKPRSAAERLERFRPERIEWLSRR